MRPLYTSASWVGVALFAATAFTGCTEKADVGPDEPCSTSATVKFCNAKTSVCLTEHTFLELADGTRIRPSGKVWQAYLPQQMNGQVLRVSYQLLPRTATDAPEVRFAELSCLETWVPFCGTR